MAEIGIPRTIPGLVVDAYLLEQSDVDLPARNPSGNKGQYGHVYVWAGVPEKQGASALVGMAALRSGAGLVSVIGEHLSELRPRLIPELMTEEVGGSFFSDKPAEVAVLGPGMGTQAKQWSVFENALRSPWTLVLDGDALTMLSEQGEKAIALINKRSAQTLLTPHPKEAARLLGCSVQQIQSDRYQAIRKLALTFAPAWIILKGRGTIIANKDSELIVVNEGDSGLSKGGTGDVLAGLVGGIVAQTANSQNIQRALAASVFVHGRASCRLSQKQGTQRASFASEIADEIPAVLSELGQ